MKKPLGHHEIAIPPVLLSAPGQVAIADPDAAPLRKARLVEVVQLTSSDAELRLTSEGLALLQRLGLAAT